MQVVSNLQITQESQAPVFVHRYVNGRKIKVDPSTLTIPEIEDTRKYYVKKQNSKEDEIKELALQEAKALEEVTQLYIQYTEAKKKLYGIQDNAKNAVNSHSTFQKVLFTLDKCELQKTGLFGEAVEQIVTNLEEAQTSDEGKPFDVSVVLEQLKEGGDAPLI